MPKRRYKYVVIALMLLCIYNFFGVGDYLHAKNFDDGFDYPMNIDLKPIIKDILAGKKPTTKAINVYPYRFLTNSGKCNTIEKLDLFIVVKSAMDHFGHRDAIRQTYGQENLIPGTIVKILFFLGIDDKSPKSKTQFLIEEEMLKYKDIIQMNFHDSYFNNTIKTMMSFRWVFEHCSTADFYLFTDDDMYISVANLLEYVHEQTDSRSNSVVETNETERDKRLFAGYLFESTPQRFKTSKWRVSLDEYAWDRWPPYVTAGAYIVSNLSMKELYIGSFYVKHFRFDDIYLAIVAKKVGIKPIHCPGIYFYKKKYSKEGYRDVIASHGYSDHDELIRVWNEMNNNNLDSG
ncbi:galactosyltransferase domain-containing protein [Phthorimaea operculella]|nr:galactosyltransferase domain-containing protein [Phthorimaea operculella]